MPYTLSHAVVSLPLTLATNKKVPIAALVIGSMSPDFSYLMALTPMYAPGHVISLVHVYCLIPSLVLLLVWYRFLQKHTLAFFHLPPSKMSFSLSTVLLALFGVTVGAYSHALWDATSHSYGIFVKGSEFWHQEFLSMPLYKLNQHGSGLLGLIVLFTWYLAALAKNKQTKYQGNLKAGIILYASSICFAVLLANMLHNTSNFLEFAVRSSIGFIVGTMIGMCLYALFINYNAVNEKAL